VQDDLALLSLFCEQTAIELGYLQMLSEQRTLIDQLSRSTERLEALNDIDRAILATSSPQEIASAALSRLRKLVPSQRASVIFFDFEQRQATYFAVDSDEDLGPLPGTVLPLDQFPARVSGSLSQEYIQDLAASPLHSPLIDRLLEKQIRSLLILPMISEGALFGELALSSRIKSAYQPEHIAIAQEVTNQLSIAIQQANLRNELQYYAAELEQRVADRSAELTARSVQLETAVHELQEEIAARKQAEENIRRLNEGLRLQTAGLNAANKELEAFAYSISHDLRAPLRSIEGFSRILLDKHATMLEGEARHYLELVRDNARDMGRLIEDLLTFSRLSRQPLSKQQVQPDDIVRVVMWDLLKGQSDRQVETLVQEMPSCSADPVLLKQVYMNLLSNAIKFSSPREIAKIEVGCLPQNGQKVYFVKDNGVGFDMRFAGKLFEVFQRLHKPEEFEGTGVGLAIVQRIIERHGGRIWAEAELDRGAVFYFTLPEEPEIQVETTLKA
jgi:signal transduction histidine kinase